MEIPTAITVTLLGGVGTCLGYFISNSLERQKQLRLREIEFRLERYREFLLALVDDYAQQTFETHTRFVNCTNVILLIGGPSLLQAIKELVENFNDKNGSVEKQWIIMDRILLQMRRDLNTPESRELKEFKFPMIVPDISRKQEGPPHQR
jgi:hypothetical protein